MSWIEKDQPTPFDDRPLTGLVFLDGDVLARVVGRDWTAGQKLPLIAFPSGKECQLWESSDPEVGGIVHIYGELDLAYRQSRDRAYDQACSIAEQVGYLVRKVGDDGLEVLGQDDDEHFLITFDQEAGQMLDIQPLPDEGERPVPPGLQLMTDEVRERLPELGATEEQGLDAQAQVKYFTPDSNWTWYASEFDGEDVFFGLVIGFEIELGYFSLSELQQARGPLGLPIERDLYFDPQSLAALRKQHRRERGE
jgi:hypothetical protein